MSESQSHRNTKNKAAGKGGRTEVPISRGRRVDAVSNGGRATEVERSGNLTAAANRLASIKATQKVLQVPQKDMANAAKAMRTAGVKGTVKNMGGTKKRSVR